MMFGRFHRHKNLENAILDLAKEVSDLKHCDDETWNELTKEVIYNFTDVPLIQVQDPTFIVKCNGNINSFKPSLNNIKILKGSIKQAIKFAPLVSKITSMPKNMDLKNKLIAINNARFDMNSKDWEIMQGVVKIIFDDAELYGLQVCGKLVLCLGGNPGYLSDERGTFIFVDDIDYKGNKTQRKIYLNDYENMIVNHLPQRPAFDAGENCVTNMGPQQKRLSELFIRVVGLFGQIGLDIAATTVIGKMDFSGKPKPEYDVASAEVPKLPLRREVLVAETLPADEEDPYDGGGFHSRGNCKQKSLLNDWRDEHNFDNSWQKKYSKHADWRYGESEKPEEDRKPGTNTMNNRKPMTRQDDEEHYLRQWEELRTQLPDDYEPDDGWDYDRDVDYNMAFELDGVKRIAKIYANLAPKSKRGAVPEALLDKQAQTVAALLHKATYKIFSRQSFVCLGVGLQNNVLVSVKHICEYPELYIEQDGKMYPLKMIAKSPDRDICFFEKVGGQMFKDVTGHMVRISETIKSELPGYAVIRARESVGNMIMYPVKMYPAQRVDYSTSRYSYKNMCYKHVMTTTGFTTSGSPMENGDCGSPYVLSDSGKTRKFISIHCASSVVYSHSAPLYYEDFTDAISMMSVKPQSAEDVKVLDHQCVKLYDVKQEYCGLTVYGEVVDEMGRRQRARNNGRTRQWYSPLYIEELSCKYEPAVMRENDPRYLEKDDMTLMEKTLAK